MRRRLATLIGISMLPLKDLRKPIRDVRQGPDGLICFLTDGAAGEVMRLEPAVN